MEEYIKLGNEEKDKIKDLCQKLFHENYITEFIFSNNDKLSSSNPEYNYILSKYRIFEELLDAVGWQLNHDSSNGVIYITSGYSGAKPVLNKIETMFLFALRIIYDKKRSSASSTGQVYTTVRDITEQLESLNAVTNITKRDRKAALSKLREKNIITRIAGELGEMDCKIAIRPSILYVISATRVKLLKEQMNEISADTEAEVDD